MKRFGAAVAVGLMVCASVPAMAQGVKPDEVVQARRAGMAMTGGITDMMKAGIAADADVKAFASAADALVAWSKAYPHLFPDGTQTIGDTKAKPEIWSDRAGFEKAAVAFTTASTNLAAAAKAGDKAAFAAAFTAEGQSCGGCHRGFKAR